MHKRLFLFTALIALTIGAQAKVRLPHLISDNMVLQQQTDARLWGWAEPGKTVKVTTSWSDQVATAKTDKNGEWLVKVKTPKASYEPLSITFDDGEPLTINNVLSGEVWVCAGSGHRCRQSYGHSLRKDSQYDACRTAIRCPMRVAHLFSEYRG